jgi:hypothetical protein
MVAHLTLSYPWMLDVSFHTSHACYTCHAGGAVDARKFPESHTAPFMPWDTTLQMAIATSLFVRIKV